MVNNNLYQSYKKPYKSVLYIGSGGVSDFRLGLAARYFSQNNIYETNFTLVLHEYLGMHYDVIICSRPNPGVCQVLNRFMDAGKKVVIDLDDDFLSIPRSNPCYPTMGAGNVGYHDILLKTIARATALTVAMPELGKRYRRDDAIVIPNCYDDENPLWNLPPMKHDYIGIGWAGTNTHHEDFDLVEKPLIETIQKYPNTKLVIGSDTKIYERFTELDETRKLYLPAMPFAYFPSFYRYIDIGIAPLQDTVFTRAKSNIKLIEAGAAGIPYIASNVLPYQSWAGGGTLVSSEDEWREVLDKYVRMDSSARSAIGHEGAMAAQSYKATVIDALWMQLIEELTQ
jgi:glycosyltransferase involved in cell wall biosynthesis